MSSVSSVSTPTVSDISSGASDLESSSDEEVSELIQRPRRFRKHADPFQEFDEVDFIQRFRLKKQTVLNIFELIQAHLEVPSQKKIPVSAKNQLLIALKFYASGSFQINIGDYFGVSQPTVCRIVHKVTHAIAILRPRYIKMPENRAERLLVCAGFYEINGFPGVCGAIDCTHVRIQSPGGNNGEIFRNRKGWFSINVQAVCDFRLKITDIVASWPGSTHDSTIFNNSLLRARFENNEFDDSYLLGDGGYACKNYLLTPVHNPRHRQEDRYNEAQIRTRNTIERTFGVLKRRFPCLSLGLRVSVAHAIPVIVACCILHNIAIDEKDKVFLNDIEVNGNDEVNDDNRNLPIFGGNVNTAVRTALINTIFA